MKKRVMASVLIVLLAVAVLLLSAIPGSAAGQRRPVGQGAGMAWGGNGFGQLGDNTLTDSHVPVQVKGPGGSGNLTGVAALSAGGDHNLALMSDGTVWAWGYNSNGQLGDNTTDQRNTPVQVLGPGGSGYLTGVVAIAAGYAHSLALMSDGTVWAWGYNGYGQLGDNTTTERDTPVQVLGSGGSGNLTGVVAIAAGGYHSLALMSDGTVWAWGYNTFGQLGENTTTDSHVPVQVKGPGGSGTLTGVVSIAAGEYHSLALMSDGTVWAWGYNIFGQLGDNTLTDRHAPVQVLGLDGSGTLTGVVAITAGLWHSLALMSDGTVWAWGNNGNGELGDNTTIRRTTPVQVLGLDGSGNLTGVVALAAGEYHSLALMSDGTAWAWGNNGYGQLGDNTTTDRHTPVQVLGPGGSGNLTGVVTLAAGNLHSLVVINNDEPGAAWGCNTFSQLGDNTTTERDAPVQVQGTGGSGNLTGVVALAAGYGHSLALKSDGTVWAWGYNGFGQLGDNTTTNGYTPVQVLGSGGSGTLTGVVAIAAGVYHSLALKNDGTVWAWGYNGHGELGDNTLTNRYTPVQVLGLDGSGTLTGVVAIAAGEFHNLALKSDGTVWAWGYNATGQLGDNTTTQRNTPVQVLGSGGSGTLTGVVALAAGGYHSLALMNDGTVWAWGYNANGELGDNTTTDRHVPVQVQDSGGSGNITGVVALAAGYSYSLALMSDGTVWAWGNNFYGQLGDNTTTQRDTPVQVQGSGGSGNLTGVVALSAGYGQSLALTSDGTAWAWGWNNNGQLGDNTTNDRHTPVQVLGPGGSGNLTGVTAIAAGRYHSLAANAPNPIPTVTSLSPTNKNVGGVAFTLTVNGTNFVGSSEVQWKGSDRTTTYLNSTQLTAAILASDIATAGTAAVTVVNPTPGGGTSNSLNFTINPKPSITSLSPTSGTTGSVVYVSGHNFGSSRGSSYVKFGSTKVGTYYSWTSTKIKVRVPAGISRTSSVVVCTSAGASNAKTFKVTPTITAISPTSGKVGTKVTIAGSAFGSKQHSGTYVKFGSRNASVYSWSNTKVVVKVPSGVSGKVYIKVTTSGGTSSGKYFTVKR